MVRSPESKIVKFSDLPGVAANLHSNRARIVSTNGCFDVLHWGHIKYLNDARALGDLLVCGLNSDGSVRRLKGENRPVFGQRERALQIASLECVDHVVIFEEDTPERFLEILKPTVHTKGGDYDGRVLPEAAVVEQGGGKIKFLPFVQGYSTTGLIAKLSSL